MVTNAHATDDLGGGLTSVHVAALASLLGVLIHEADLELIGKELTAHMRLSRLLNDLDLDRVDPATVFDPRW